MRKKTYPTLAASLSILLIACSCGGVIAPSPAAVAAPSPAPQPQWDLAFYRTSGWTGGDVAASLVIPGHRVLWVFGDSWVGEVEDNRHVRAVLVNNAIAIHPYDPARPTQAPAPGQMRFYWGPPDASGKPTAWVRPAPAAANARTWYWPTGGGVIVPELGADRLALFLILLASKPGADAVWGFQCIGSAVAVIDQAAEPAERWQPRVLTLPHQLDPEPAEAPGSRQVDWGVAALYEPGGEGSPGFVYIYGAESDRPNHRDLVLARVRPARFESFAQWEFWAREGKWAASPNRARPVVRDIASELSVDRLYDDRGVYYLMVSSEPSLGDRILLRGARSPAGPWTEARPIFQVPEVKESKTLFAYAAKGHAPLSAPGSLLISYIVNSNDFNELANNAGLYRPRFIAVSP